MNVNLVSQRFPGGVREDNMVEYITCMYENLEIYR